jgi:broad specificity phosphatase PhoE
MELMRVAMGLHPSAYRTDERLRELTFGAWEGLRWKEVRSKHPTDAAARERDKWGFVPPQGESYAMLTERVRPFVEGITRDTVVVAHGGVARAFLVLRSHVSIQHAPRVDIWQGKLLVFEGRKHDWV